MRSCGVSQFEAFVRKLRVNTQIPEDDIGAIEALAIHVKQVPADWAVVLEGDRPVQCCLIINGFAIRTKTSDRGKRHILSVHIPGDMPDLHSLHLHVMDHDLRTLSPCTLGFIPHGAIRSLIRSRPVIAEALWRETLIDAAIFREWIVNGRRSANERLAHFILEMKRRLEVVGLATNGQFELPMTQLDLADALGLSPVHVNRVMQTLRADSLLEFRKYAVALGDAERLVKLGDFDDVYLHQSPDA